MVEAEENTEAVKAKLRNVMTDNAKKTLKVTLVKSKNGRLKSHQACVKGLGLRKIGQTVELEDTPSVRGMINKVYYMVQVDA